MKVKDRWWLFSFGTIVATKNKVPMLTWSAFVHRILYVFVVRLSPATLLFTYWVDFLSSTPELSPGISLLFPRGGLGTCLLVGCGSFGSYLGVPLCIQNIENGTRTLCICYRVKWWLQLENKGKSRDDSCAMVNTWERCYVCNVTSQQWWIYGGYPGATPPYSFRPNPTCFSLHNRRYFFAFSGERR